MAAASASRRIAVVYLTPSGGDLARRLEQAWLQDGGCGAMELLEAARPASSMVQHIWRRYDSFIFIMAAGIVIRLIAPLLESKWRDPGVVVVDERGHFAVSLVGGHWGDANRLAREAAACLGAVPVITTATDVQGKPAIDLLAKQWGFLPVPGERVKVVSSALLAGEQVEIFSEWDLSSEFGPPEREAATGGPCGRLPQPGAAPGESLPGARLRASQAAASGMELFSCHSLQEFVEGTACFPDSGSDGGRGPSRTGALDPGGAPAAASVLVTSRLLSLPSRGVFLRPPSLAAGIGCRRGVTAGEIRAALEEALRLAGRSRDSLAALASHEIKSDEEGLLEAARQLGLVLRLFNSRSLEQIFSDHPGLQRSHFVQQRLGVGGVCEAAALAAIPDGALVLPKIRAGSVTVALAEAGWLWSASGRAIRRI